MSIFAPFTFIAPQEEAAEPAPPLTGYRYWRYAVGSAVDNHHPRVSRIDLLDASSNVYNVITYVADNCADSGTIPGVGNIDKDFGAGNLVDAANAQFYNTYTGARRAANVTLYHSDDGVNWTSSLVGVADSDANPASPRCGLHTIVPPAGEFIIANGGTVTTDGDYKIHTFTSNGTFSVTQSSQNYNDIDYLIVAGGGAGGGYVGGGGGAGGVIYTTGSSGLNAINYSIVVGAGGTTTSNGSNSTFFSQTAIGGGRGAKGGCEPGQACQSGGSGGGGGSGTTITGCAGTDGQGNTGGDATACTPPYSSGGGGGAGAVGANGSASGGGNGGNGLQISISGTPTYYGGGGGGCSTTQGGATPGTGGL